MAEKSAEWTLGIWQVAVANDGALGGWAPS